MSLTVRPLLAAAALVAAGVLATGTADARVLHHAAGPTTTTTWAPAATAAIHPGVMMYTDGAQCTANFVFTDTAGDVFVGYAAHCAGTGAATDTNGCTAPSLGLNTPVTFNEGGSVATEGTVVGTGKLVYSSWLDMQARGEADPDTCAYNDLALVKVDAAYAGDVNPSIPFWGGPAGITTTGTAVGDQLYTYGNSSLRGGVSVLSPHVGVSLGDDANGWTHALYSVGPGIPGDSGSAFLDANGNAVGVLSTLGLAPLPLSNNIGDLSHELTYAQAHSGIAGLALVTGTEPFSSVL